EVVQSGWTVVARLESPQRIPLGPCVDRSRRCAATTRSPRRPRSRRPRSSSSARSADTASPRRPTRRSSRPRSPRSPLRRARSSTSWPPTTRAARPDDRAGAGRPRPQSGRTCALARAPSALLLMVGLLLVSHSRQIAAGLAELVAQVSGAEAAVEAVGGAVDGSLGTDGAAVLAALRRACARGETLVLMDLGSAVLSV